jgi:hypothetical protein
MRAKLTLLSALAFGTLTGALAAGCQSYDFEPVEPLALAQTTFEESINARSSKPNIMLLVDTSGSMTFPVNASDPDCRVVVNGQTRTCGGEIQCNTSVCPTRWTELQAAVPQFLSTAGPSVRFGLTTYPSGNEPNTSIYCAASVDSSVRQPLPVADDDASLLAHANSINAIIQGIPNSGQGQPVGGTPTSGSLTFVGNLPGLQSAERKDFVILLTDGLPNCNKDNVNAGTSGEAVCRCTLLPDAECTGSFVRRGCLDKDASVAAVRALKEKNITTIVIGFGAETAGGVGQEVLGAMAEAGGFVPKCDAQNACPNNDTCNLSTGLCTRPIFYQAGNQAQLAQALDEISKEVTGTNPCLIELAADQIPSDSKLIVVYVDGERVASGPETWDPDVEAKGGVLFTGAMCRRILASTPENPVNVEVRAIRQR